MTAVNGMLTFSIRRWWAMVVKEFLQLRRDRVSLGMIIGIPVIQLVLFGFAINTNPKQLPTAVISYDHSEFTRSFVAALRNSDYFRIVENLPDEQSAYEALTKGEMQFVLNIPADFTRRLLRGERPALLLEADATDPGATGMALGIVQQLAFSVAAKDLTGPLGHLAGGDPPFEVRVHRLYNPESNSQYNTVPGLMGVILTFTMVMMTGLAVTRERERGTMENLLSTPVRPLEVMAGKITPYIAIGLVQASIILGAAFFMFKIPFQGSITVVYLGALLFVAANLTVGITLSSIARNQLQAMQMTVFYFLPSILLSGFMFPFRGMPDWAQYIGSCLPLTYFNRFIRGILLKGAGWEDSWPHIWPILLFACLFMGISVKFYRKTLD